MVKNDYNNQNLCICGLAETDCIGVEEFIENTKQYAEGISPTMEGVAGDDDDDDEEPVKHPDELPLHQKVIFCFCLHVKTCWIDSLWTAHVVSCSHKWHRIQSETDCNWYEIYNHLRVNGNKQY